MKCLALASALMLALAGCSSPDVDIDSEPADSGVADSGPLSDLGSSTGSDTGDAGTGVDLERGDQGTPDLGASNDAACTGACETTSVEVSVPPNTATFERAYFGFTSADASESGKRELHVEAYVGGADGCPQMNSPTSDHTLIVTGMAAPESGTSYTREDGLVVSVLDFEGTLIDDGLVVKAIEASSVVTFLSEERVALDLTAMLEGGGTADGHLFAEHCDSFDVP